MIILQVFDTTQFKFFSDDLPEGEEFQVIGDIKKLLEAEKETKLDSNGSANGDTNGKDTTAGGKIYEFCWLNCLKTLIKLAEK